MAGDDVERPHRRQERDKSLPIPVVGGEDQNAFPLGQGPLQMLTPFDLDQIQDAIPV